jgi:putative MATE family efflux protein
MFTFLLSISVVISIVCYALRSQILELLNTPAASYSYTMDYTVTCIVGLVFIYGYNLISAILRGMGDSRRPFLFIAIAAILNMVLDVLFVKYFNMEVFGAALATVIGQGVSFLVSLIYLYRRKESFGFDFRLPSFRIDPDSFQRLLALGIPMAIQSAAINISKIVLMAWINVFDVTYSALAGIFNKVNVMYNVITQAFTSAGATMVGQNLEARKYRRVNKTLLTILFIGALLSLAGTLLLLKDPDAVYAIFTGDLDVLSAAGVLTLPLILCLYGAATRSVSFSLINGSGKPALNLAVAIIDGMLARIGLAALLGFAFHLDCYGFWMGDALAGFMPFLIGLIFYLSGRWKEKEIV